MKAEAPPWGRRKLELIGVTKRFAESGVTANHRADFSAALGEIHALVGENGSGKSTLMHITCGLVRPDDGQIVVDGIPAALRSPADALRRGIGMVHQRLPFVPSLSIAENIALGAAGRDRLPRRRAAMLSAAESVCGRYGISVDLGAEAGRTTASERTRIALVSLLVRDPDVVILDEPTSTFTEEESDAFFAVVRRLGDAGKAVVFITHKLREVLALAHRVSVMRRGEVVASAPVSDVDEEAIARAMMGGEQDSRSAAPLARAPVRNSHAAGDGVPVFELRSVGVRRGGGDVLAGVSLAAHRGTVTVVTGIRENGAEEVEQICVGSTEPTAGSIFFEGAAMQRWSPEVWRPAGVGCVPSDRIGTAVVIDLPVADNVALVKRRVLANGLVLDHGAVHRHCAGVLQEVGLAVSPSRRLRTLSGGMIQRVVLARELDAARTLLILSEPYWGLDLRGRRILDDRIERLRAAGTAVLVFASDPDDVVELADRIVVIAHGRTHAVLNGGAVDREELGRLILGYEARR